MALADPATCELALDAAAHFEDVLLSAGLAIGTPEMDAIVDSSVDIAESMLEYMDSTDYASDATLVRWHDTMTAIDASRMQHLAGIDTPFIEAVGAAALARPALVAACT